MILDGLKNYGLVILAAILSALLLTQTLRLAGAKQGEERARADLQAARADATAAALAQSERHRTLEQANHEAITKIQTQGQAAIAAADAGAARARLARDGLRRELADYLTDHRRAAIARAAAGSCAPDTAPLDLLAQLQRSADARAGELAHIADTARARGSACERAYNSARAMTAAAR